MLKRIVSLLLVLVMLVGNLPPMPVRATETQPIETTLATEEAAVSEQASAPEEPSQPVNTAAAEETTLPAETSAPEETTSPAEETAPPSGEATAPTAATVPEETTAPAEAETTMPSAEETTAIPETTEQESADLESADSQSGAAANACGASAFWMLSVDGILIITGSGAMDSYTSASNTPWYSQRDSILEIRVEEGITTIGDYAFAKCEKAAAIKLPDSLLSIGKYAFDGCKAMTSFTIPQGITATSAYMLRNCTALTQVILPQSLRSIGEYSFYGCSALESLTIPSGVTAIGYKAFGSCKKLTSISLPVSWTECPSTDPRYTGNDYQGNLFISCTALTSVTLPQGLTVIPENAFANAPALKTVVIPASVQEIRRSAFNRCSDLTEAVVPEGVTTLPAYTFYNCTSLQTLSLPSTLTSLGREVLRGCSSLKTLTIPEGVVSIGYRAFYDCKSMESISLPLSWTECPSYDPNYNTTSYRGNLFAGCQALTSITLPEGMEKIPTYAFVNATYVQSIQLPDSLKDLGSSAFENCKALKSLAIPEGITAVTPNMFKNCTALTKVTLPQSLRSIEEYGFYNCAVLESLTIPSGVTSIGFKAFGSCKKLSSISLPVSWTECPSTDPRYSGIDYQGNLFISCTALTSLVLPEGLTVIPENAFCNSPALKTIVIPASVQEIRRSAFNRCSALTEAVVPEGVTALAAYTFYNCTSLKSVSLPSTLKSLGREAFNGCSVLESLVIPNGVESIGYRAFAKCTKLSSISLPASWNSCPSYSDTYSGTSYQGNLFVDCKALKSVTVPEGLTALPAYAFYNAGYVESVQLPASLTTLGDQPFYYCSALRSMEVPDGVKEISKNAFYYCSALESILLPDSVTKIGNSAFYGCKALKEIVIGPNVTIGSQAFSSVPLKGTLNSLSWSMDMDNRTLTISGTGDMVLPQDENEIVTIPWRHLRTLTNRLILSEGITSIDIEAFSGFTNITHVNTSETVIGVARNAFAGCIRLEQVILGSAVRAVSENAFAGCTALKQVIVVPEEEISFDGTAFPDSGNLTITYPETQKAFGDTISTMFPNVQISTWDNTLPGRDVVLVLDISGSMSGIKLQNLKTAVKLFLDRVGGVLTNSRVAVVAYESSAYVKSNFSLDMEELKYTVDLLQSGGGTNYCNALVGAEKVLDQSNNDIQAMIFFTDGEPNDSKSAILDKCDELRKYYRIYTVGFQTSQSGQELLVKMAGDQSRYFQSDDMDTLAEAFKSLSGGVGSEIEEEEYYSLTAQRQFTIKTLGGFPMDVGFQIQLGDKIFTSGLAPDASVPEENIIIDVPEDYTGDVVISRDGYRSCTMPITLVGNTNTVIMYPDTYTEPYHQQLLYMPVTKNQNYRTCFAQVSIAEASVLNADASLQRFYVDIQWNGRTPGSVWLQQGDVKLILQDKQFSDIAFSNTFKANQGSLYLYYESADGYLGSVKTSIYVAQADNRIKLDMGEPLIMPQKEVDKLIFFEDLKVDFSEITELPLWFEIDENGTITGTIGLFNNDGPMGASVKGKGATLKEAFDKLEKRHTMTEAEWKKQLAELKKFAPPKESSVTLKGRAWIMGRFSGKLENGLPHISDFDAYVLVEGSVSKVSPLPITIMGMPTYFHTQLKGVIEGNIGMIMESGVAKPLDDARVDVKVTLSLGGGVGIRGLLSGGVQGDGTVGIEHYLIHSERTKAYLQAELSMVGSFLGIYGTWDIWDLPSKAYFYSNGKFHWPTGSLPQPSAVITPMLEPVHHSQFFPSGERAAIGNMDYLCLKSDTTMYSEPRLLVFDDGTKLVVWLDAVPGRTGVDVHGLYYSYFDGTSWSAPALVHDDGTNDFGASLVEINGDGYVLWHDYDVALGMDLDEINVASEHINVSVAKFDPASASIAATAEFSRAGYDHEPQLSSVNGQLQLAWKVGFEESETMYSAVSTDGESWDQSVEGYVSWYSETEGLPSDYNGEVLSSIGQVQTVSHNGLRAILFKAKDFYGTQNVYAVYNSGSGWGKPIQLTFFSGGTYVDAFGGDFCGDQLELAMNLTHASGKSDLAYQQIPLGTDLEVEFADYDHFSLVPGKTAVFQARVTNRGHLTEDMVKLRLLDADGTVLKTQLSDAVIASGDTVTLEMNYVVPADNSLKLVSLAALPVHGNDLDLSNNTKSVSISYKDVSVEQMRAYVSEEGTTVIVRIVNRGSEPLTNISYTLHYRTPDGTELTSGTIAALEAGKVEMLTLELEALEENELLYFLIDELEEENLISNNEGLAKILSVYNTVATVRNLSLDREYVALETGERVQLKAECGVSVEEGRVRWRVETAEGTNVVSVTDRGEVTAINPGTAYVVAYVENPDSEVTARCRVDVTRQIQLQGITLGTTKAVTELFRTDYTEIDILLKLPQNYSVTAEGSASALPEDLGVAIDSARFTDEAMAQLFQLIPGDDRTLAIVPTDYAIENTGKVRSSYTGTIAVTVDGAEYFSEALNLMVKKSQPKLKVTVPAFNAFYSGQAQEISVKGATATSIYADTTHQNAIPEWLYLSKGSLMLTEAVPQKSISGKVHLMVELAEWRLPASVTVTVKSSSKAPGLKLSASGVTFSQHAKNSEGIALKLLCKSNKDTLASLGVSGIQAPAGYTIENFNALDGTFVLKPEANFRPGKIALAVTFRSTSNTLPLALTVKAADISLKPSVRSITLNTATQDSAEVEILASPADYRIADPSIRVTDKSGTVNKRHELDVRFENGKLTVSTKTNTPAGAQYKLGLTAGGSKELIIPVKTIAADVRVSFKAKGNLDLSFPDKALEITPTFRNYGGNFTLVDTAVGPFSLKLEDKTILVSCTEQAAAGNYVLPLKLKLEDGTPVENDIKLTVKCTAIKLKLSATKLTLNKAVNDTASIAVTSATTGYTLITPVWQLMDKSGKVSAEGRLDIQWADGKLRIATKNSTEYGATYKLLLAAQEDGAQTALTITIPAQAKSAVTATLKVKGSLDVIRSSSVTVTPSYKNCAAGTARTEELMVVSSDNQIVTDQFDIAKNDDGTYTLTIAEGAEIDLSRKYQVQLTAAFGETSVRAKPAALSIKMGSAKLSIGTDGTLFSQDKHSRVNLAFVTPDSTLNGVARVEIKDARQAETFEILDYGNGDFAIGFRDGRTVQSAKPITLTLNIYLKGNTSAKPNASFKLKLSIVP